MRSDNRGNSPRYHYSHLFVLSTRNITDRSHWMTYPASFSLNQIHDPGQAWNALTIGAYTTKTTLDEPEYQPVTA